MRRSARAASVVTLLVLSASAGQAAERLHTVIAGESASAIAKKYYGDYALTDLLLQFNQRRDSALRPGERLRIPYSVTHVVRSGDSWSAIAQRYLGRTSSWRALATLNGFRGNALLRPGQRIVIPVLLDYRLRRGESLAALAKRFYGETESASILAGFNHIDDPRRLSVGQTLVIPLTDFRLRSSAVRKTKPPRSATAREKPRAAPAERTAVARVADPEPARKQTPAVAAEPVKSEASAAAPPTEPVEDPVIGKELQTARQAWRRGEYARVRALLGDLDTERASDSQRVAYWRLLAFVHVAFDSPESACRAWSKLDVETRAADLDPDLVSPKIRATLAGCPS